MTVATQTHPDWPALLWPDWQDTAVTLQLWTQVVGKIRLALAPYVNHWWHIPLYVTSRGLGTSPMPYGNRTLEIDFDFLSHQLVLQTCDGQLETLPLRPMTVADFYRDVMARLNALQMPVSLWTTPVEMPDPIPFEQDKTHSAYDAVAVTRFWRALIQADRVMKLFRGEFIGKASPVHFFWGSFDLAVTRFSGRTAPEHPGGIPHMADHVTRSAYSHEVSSCGFWPGGPAFPEPAFYAYAYPVPEGFKDATIAPDAARFHAGMGEFILPYEAVRTADDPDAMLLAFLRSTYTVTADLAHWDRAALELHSAPAK